MVETTDSVIKENFEKKLNETVTTKITTNIIDDHYNPSVRLLQIPKTETGSCGFHLSRSKWDPYPWVSAVDTNTPAEQNGLKAGDCILEVNGEDVLGLRIIEVANLVKTKQDNVSLLVWSSGTFESCDSESICCGPMPLNLERLSASMQTILTALECPVCMNTIPPPVIQCQNGHLLCAKCRSRSEKCPICRERYMTGRSLIAEQIYNSIMDAFNLREQINFDSKLLRDKLFGAKYKKNIPISLNNNKMTCNSSNNIQSTSMISTSLSSPSIPVSSSLVNNKNYLDVNRIYHTPKNKFLSKILGKSSSLDNLSNHHRNTNTRNNNNSNNSYNNNNINISNCNDNDNIIQGFIRNENLNNLKSLSTNDISKKDVDLLMIPIRFPSVNRLESNYGSSTGELREFTLFDKIPTSLHTSTECLGRASSSDVSLTIPIPRRNNDENLYNCPINCGKKLTGTSIQHHVKMNHNIPIVLFGSSNVEITMPLSAPFKDAFFILIHDYKDFWLKLTINDDGSIFTSALLQGYDDDENSEYMIEVRLKNCIEGDRLLERELITRSICYSLMSISWNEILDKRLGISFSSEIISTTFLNESNLNLRIDIKSRNEQ